MKHTSFIMGSIISFSIVGSSLQASEQTRVPYLEAQAVSYFPSLSRADIQRQLVLLSSQSRLTPSWPPIYREIAEISLNIGRGDLAERALRKFHSLQNNSVMAQLELINLEVRGISTIEGRRQYLENKLKQTDLLPEVISDIYRQLAQISWQNFENERARKYLDLAIRRVPQNLSAHELLRRIVRSDHTTTPIRELEVRIGELQGRLMTNPFDAQAAIEMAVICGKINVPERMRFWLDYSNRLGSVTDDLVAWPIDLRLEVAESFLAIGDPERAVKILTALLAQPTSLPATSPSENADPYPLLHARVLLALAAGKLGDNNIVAKQHEQLLEFADKVLAQKHGPASSVILAVIYFTLYAEQPDYLRAVSLARIARQTSPNDPMTAIALALPLAIIGEGVESEALLNESREPNHPLVLSARAFIESNKKNSDKARELLTRAAMVTPYGPLHDYLLKAAERLGVSIPEKPALGDLDRKIDQFDARYLSLATGEKLVGEITLNARGRLDRGQLVDLEVAFTNRSEVPLAVGPGSLIHPFFVLEFTPVNSRTKNFVYYLPIEARQILEPGKSIDATMLLDQIEGWDDFVIQRDPAISRVTLQARLMTIVPFGKTSTVTLAQSPIVAIELPTLDRSSAQGLIERLNKPVLNDSWGAARLARYFLRSPGLQDRHAAIIDGMLKQLDVKNPDSTRTAFIWAMRTARPDEPIINALASQLKSKNWFVRFMTLDTLGVLQGKTANKLFEFYAADDCDELVRQLSTGYLLRHR
ncbi:MAG: hypothetical protein GX629_00055 [Phycisphaerae bacterium]|nr:hypothetical protein [Phycisphaerae bacterium]